MPTSIFNAQPRRRFFDTAPSAPQSGGGGYFAGYGDSGSMGGTAARSRQLYGGMYPGASRSVQPPGSFFSGALSHPGDAVAGVRRWFDTEQAPMSAVAVPLSGEHYLGNPYDTEHANPYADLIGGIPGMLPGAAAGAKYGRVPNVTVGGRFGQAGPVGGINPNRYGMRVTPQGIDYVPPGGGHPSEGYFDTIARNQFGGAMSGTVYDSHGSRPGWLGDPQGMGESDGMSTEQAQNRLLSQYMPGAGSKYVRDPSGAIRPSQAFHAELQQRGLLPGGNPSPGNDVLGMQTFGSRAHPYASPFGYFSPATRQLGVTEGARARAEARRRRLGGLSNQEALEFGSPGFALGELQAQTQHDALTQAAHEFGATNRLGWGKIGAEQQQHQLQTAAAILGNAEAISALPGGDELVQHAMDSFGSSNWLKDAASRFGDPAGAAPGSTPAAAAPSTGAALAAARKAGAYAGKRGADLMKAMSVPLDAAATLGPNASKEQLAAIARQHGLTADTLRQVAEHQPFFYYRHNSDPNTAPYADPGDVIETQQIGLVPWMLGGEGYNDFHLRRGRQDAARRIMAAIQ
jgi:hypothetical protein